MVLLFMIWKWNYGSKVLLTTSLPYTHTHTHTHTRTHTYIYVCVCVWVCVCVCVIFLFLIACICEAVKSKCWNSYSLTCHNKIYILIYVHMNIQVVVNIQWSYDIQSAIISQKQDGGNICVIMKSVCSPGTSCGQVHELSQSHWSYDREGRLFSGLCIIYIYILYILYIIIINVLII